MDAQQEFKRAEKNFLVQGAITEAQVLWRVL
ncbi:hypothetical protein METHPM2_1290007 [Pseudomonas sp. PM2]